MKELKDFDVLKQAIEHFWNWRWARAEELLAPRISPDPTGWPFCAFHAVVSCCFLEIWINQDEEKCIARFVLKNFMCVQENSCLSCALSAYSCK
jgi:hypothetical protein